MLASTLSFWEWEARSTVLYYELLNNLGLDPQKATKLAVKLHAIWFNDKLIYLLIPDVFLRRLLQLPVDDDLLSRPGVGYCWSHP